MKTLEHRQLRRKTRGDFPSKATHTSHRKHKGAADKRMKVKSPEELKELIESFRKCDLRSLSRASRVGLGYDLRWLARTFGPRPRLFRERLGPLLDRELRHIQRDVQKGVQDLMATARTHHHPDQRIALAGSWLAMGGGWRLPRVRMRLCWPGPGLGLRVDYEFADETAAIVAAIAQCRFMNPRAPARLCACGCGQVAREGKKYATEQCGQNVRFRRHYAAVRAGKNDGAAVRNGSQRIRPEASPGVPNLGPRT